MSEKTTRSLLRRGAVAVAGLVAASALAACSSSSSSSSASSAPATGGSSSATAAAAAGLMHPGVLTVGMNLQFKPEMYLDSANKPAGYDVDLLNKLAAKLGVKLQIQNLDFNGSSPG